MKRMKKAGSHRRSPRYPRDGQVTGKLNDRRLGDKTDMTLEDSLLLAHSSL
jgi:hypothetical protein